MCRKKLHVTIGDSREIPDLICGKTAVGGNYNSTRDNDVAIGEIDNRAISDIIDYVVIPFAAV